MKILNFGSLNIDKVYHVPHFVRPGETISSDGFMCFAGGKGLNQSIAASRAGQEVFHAGTIGHDGEDLKRILEESSVDTRYVRTCDYATGHALIQLTEEGENCIILMGGSNLRNDREYIDTVLADFDSEDILMLQNEINNLDYLLERGREKGMRIMLNPSPMDENLKKANLSAVTWLMLNETEGRDLTGHTDPARIAESLLERWPDMKVILTLGEEGAIYRDKDTALTQPCFPAKVKDTTAAGDTFTGYFVAAALEEKTPQEALRLATAASSIAVSRPGASVSIPLREDVEAKLAGEEVR